jgi:hypothetical protein
MWVIPLSVQFLRGKALVELQREVSREMLALGEKGAPLALAVHAAFATSSSSSSGAPPPLPGLVKVLRNSGAAPDPSSEQLTRRVFNSWADTSGGAGNGGTVEASARYFMTPKPGDDAGRAEFATVEKKEHHSAPAAATTPKNEKRETGVVKTQTSPQAWGDATSPTTAYPQEWSRAVRIARGLCDAL